MDSSTSFWLGLALAIPTGILVNLATPFIGRFIATRNEKFRRQSSRRTGRERAFARWLIANPQAMALHFSNQRSRQSVLLTGTVFVTVIYVMGMLSDDMLLSRLTGATSITFLVAYTGLYFRNVQRLNRIWDAILKEAGWITWKGRHWIKDEGVWRDAPLDAPELIAQRAHLQEKGATPRSEHTDEDLTADDDAV